MFRQRIRVVEYPLNGSVSMLFTKNDTSTVQFVTTMSLRSQSYQTDCGESASVSEVQVSKCSDLFPSHQPVDLQAESSH